MIITAEELKSENEPFCLRGAFHYFFLFLIEFLLLQTLLSEYLECAFKILTGVIENSNITLQKGKKKKN